MSIIVASAYLLSLSLGQYIDSVWFFVLLMANVGLVKMNWDDIQTYNYLSSNIYKIIAETIKEHPEYMLSDQTIKFKKGSFMVEVKISQVVEPDKNI